MHEDVFAGLGGDEAVALVGVEPFHGSNRHAACPSLHRLGGSTHVDVTLTPTARGKLDLRVARQNVNLWRAHGDGYGHRPPPPSTTTRVSEHAYQEDEAALCRDPSHPAGLPAQGCCRGWGQTRRAAWC